MKLIAAVDKNWAIGYKNQLLVQIPEDMQRFKNLTQNHVVFMGKNTLLSLPNASPLPNRRNIVLTSDKEFKAERTAIVHSIEEALREFEKYPSDEIYIIGGASVYNQFLPYVKEALITYIQYKYIADAWFPRLDDKMEWEMKKASEEFDYCGIKYQFREYIRKENSQRLLCNQSKTDCADCPNHATSACADCPNK